MKSNEQVRSFFSVSNYILFNIQAILKITLKYQMLGKLKLLYVIMKVFVTTKFKRLTDKFYIHL
ncbi:MAG TPA: hypothetical protein DDY67_04800 [Streptococcus salivarius]|jgi:hypothetical protein|nr:hypothetical protein [Streptococcus salivarius]